MFRYLHSSILFVFLAGIALGSFGEHVRADLRGSGVFSDVPAGAYYDDAVGEMYSRGIITGYADGRFGPDDNVTRGQIAVIMQRFLDQAGGSTVTSSSSSSSSSSSNSSVSSAANNENGAFRFSIGEFSVSESSPTASITVVRTSGKTGKASVEYETIDGTAVAGEDYTANSGRLDFDDGESTKTISINLSNDEDGEESETFKVTLKNPTGGAELSSPAEVTVTILDNDDAGNSSSSVAATENGAFSFDAVAYSISEEAGQLKVYVKRDGTAGEVSVQYQTKDGTASAGSQYESANGTLTFSAGNSSQLFSINILGNTNKDGNKVFSIELSNPTGGAVIQTNSIDVTIADDEVVSTGSGSLKFDDSEYVVQEGDTVHAIVSRIGGTTGELSADYNTTNGTAKSGFDYDSTSGTITFREGESQKAIVIPTSDDAQNESNETFSITLTEGSHSTSLASPSSTSVVISE